MTSNLNFAAVAWCEERLLRRGEPLHLARLFSPPALRARTTAIGALYVEFESIIDQPRDLNVARMKLAWWRDELGRLEMGEPAHPATKLLATANVTRTMQHLLDLVTGMELNLLEGRPRDPATARVCSERGGAQLIAALNVRLEAADRGSDDLTDCPMGRGIALARLLRWPPGEALSAELAASVRKDLTDARGRLTTSAAAIRVLAALAWHQAQRPAPGRATGPGKQRLDTLRAWQAARGKLPRGLRANKGAQSRQSGRSGA
ncbi:MAG: squalene/phytoene synthase family protein [Gammaproteobacteria bacterium]|nr:squalene/phytoene synthase family protein [Gammaproteobacteria bacterium]